MGHGTIPQQLSGSCAAVHGDHMYLFGGKMLLVCSAPMLTHIDTYLDMFYSLELCSNLLNTVLYFPQ